MSIRATIRAKKAAALIRKHQGLLDQGREFYAQADAVLERLRDVVQPGEVIDVSGKPFMLKDEFAGQTKLWKPCGINRWSIKEVKEKKEKAKSE